MFKSDAGQAIGQKRIEDKNIYIKRPAQCQHTVTCHVDDDKPFEQSGFCHYLKIKHFDTRVLLPGEKITKKQKRAMESIVANCIKLPHEKIKIAFGKRFYGKGSPAAMSGYGYRPFDHVRKLFENAGYIKTYAPKTYNVEEHLISWMQGTKKLYDKISSNAFIEYKPDFVYLMKGVVEEQEQYTYHCDDDMPGIEKKKKRQYIPLPNPNRPKIRKIRNIMELYHRQLEQHDITCNVPEHIVYEVQKTLPDVNFKYPIVIFSDNIKSGGRLYNSWWTGCKKEYRNYLRIDNEKCVELDFKAMHPGILYQIEGYQQPNNIYIYDKPDMRREVVKLLLLVLINIRRKTTLKATRGDVIKAVITELKGRNISLEYKEIECLLKEIETRHYKIKKHFYNAAWRYCTFQESNLIREIIKAAILKKILVLSVHDSIICKAKDIEKISAIIKAKTDLPVTQKMFK